MGMPQYTDKSVAAHTHLSAMVATGSGSDEAVARPCDSGKISRAVNEKCETGERHRRLGKREVLIFPCEGDTQSRERGREKRGRMSPIGVGKRGDGAAHARGKRENSC